MIANSDITFVVQGPVEQGTTQRSLETLRQQFPGATIILSTWQDADVQGLDYDRLVLNTDPGATTIMFNKVGRPHRVNINRQIVSTLNGLRRVETDYAVKLRADNVLHSDKLKKIYCNYQSFRKEQQFLEHRVLLSNLYAHAYIKGVEVPFFFSDFFYFGKTQDLLSLWDIPLFSDYEFKECRLGRRQHDQYPRAQITVEQMLYTTFLKKFMPVPLHSKFGDRKLCKLSQVIAANNFIICDSEMLDLEVPARHQNNLVFPDIVYNHQQWLSSYRKHCDKNAKIIDSCTLHNLTKLVTFVWPGIKQRFRLTFSSLK